MRALLITATVEGALACIQSIGRRGHEVLVVARDPAPPYAASKYVTKCVRLVAAADTMPARVDSLAKLVANEQVDVVVPLTDDEARVVAAARERHPAVRAFVSSSVESVAIASDKIATMELAQTLGIATPPSIVVEDRGEIFGATARLGLPLVIKLPVATASAGTFVAPTRGEVKRIAATLPPGRVLLQQFVEGTRVDVTGFAQDGLLIESFAFRHAAASAGGTPTYAVVEDDPRLHATLGTFCEALRWTGGIDLDLIRDKSGDLFLLEINPRLSGTVVFADKLGIDLPGYYLAFVAGEKVVPSPPKALPRDALFVSLVGEVAHISANPVAGQKQAAELRRGRRVLDNIYVDDGPLVAAQMRDALRIAWNTRRV